MDINTEEEVELGFPMSQMIYSSYSRCQVLTDINPECQIQ